MAEISQVKPEPGLAVAPASQPNPVAQPAPATTASTAALQAATAAHKRKAEQDLDNRRVYDIRRRVNAAKLVDKIRADAPDYLLPFGDMRDVWRRLAVFYTVPQTPQPPKPEDPASGVVQKVKALDQQFDQLRASFKTAQNKIASRRPPSVKHPVMDDWTIQRMQLQDEKAESAAKHRQIYNEQQEKQKLITAQRQAQWRAQHGATFQNVTPVQAYPQGQRVPIAQHHVVQQIPH